MKTDLVEVIGGVEAQMAGEAVEALRGAGIPVDVRSAAIDLLKLARPGRIQSLAYVYVAPGDLERARELLAVKGFPTRPAPGSEATFEEEASSTGPADESVRDFLDGKK
jgi:hypothetical protein